MNSKKQTIIIIGVLVAVTLGILLWVNQQLNNIDEDKNKTLQLSPTILNNFKDNKTVYDYPLQSSKPEWGNHYLVVENGGYDMGINYKTDWNEKLGTESNFPGKDVKGIIVIGMDMVEKGIYVGKFGQEDKAYQRNYIISYFDIYKKTVVARDTLYGEDPPLSKRTVGSVAADFPSDKEVINSIKSRLK